VKFFFSKRIGNKNIKIYVQSHESAGEERWGVSSLCPWCGKTIKTLGYKTTASAAKGFFDDLNHHYRRYHKP